MNTVAAGRGPFARTLIGLESGLAGAALAGGLQLAVIAPHSAMPAAVLARTPFTSWIWPGVLLVLIVAMPAALVAIGAWRGDAFAHVGHPIVGVALIAWVIIQIAVIGPISLLQPAMAGWGGVILSLGLINFRQWRPQIQRQGKSEPPLRPTRPVQ